MNESSLQKLLDKGIAAAKSGRREQARQLLTQVIELDETSVKAWLWLSAVVTDPVDKFLCLQNVLHLDPNNKPAQLGLARLEQPDSPVKLESSLEPAELKAQPLPPESVETSPSPAEAAEISPPSQPSPEATAPAQPSPKKHYKKLTPLSPPHPSSPPRPPHLQEHPSIAAALLKKDLASRRPPPDVDAPAAEPFPESLVGPATPVAESEPEPTGRPLDVRQTMLRVLIIIVSLLLCAPCSIYGGMGVFHELALRQQGKIVEAHITEHKIDRIANGAEVYEVRYRFSLDGKTWYSYADESGRDDLWAAVPKNDWDTAWSTKRLKVLYMPHNPGINRPLNVSEHVSLLGDPLTAIALAVVVSSIFLIGGLSLTMFFPRRSAKPTLPERVAITRYKRVAPDQNQQLPVAKRPGHLQEHASMAAALIQKKPSPGGTFTAESGASGKRTLPVAGSGDLCPFCRQSISAAATCCQHCDLPLVVDCPACGNRLDVEFETCFECGYEMSDFRSKTTYFAGLAAAYQAHQHYRNSFDTWQIVGRLNPDYPQLRLRQAEAQAGSGRAETAIAMLREVLAENPGQEQASLVLGKILHELSYWDEAKAIYEKALSVSPASSELHFALGWLLMEQGYLKKAFAHIQKVTRLNPEHGLAWFRLGQLYEVWPKPKLAVAAYRKAAALLPEHTVARQKARSVVGVLDPELPQVLATGWLEFSRQAAGPLLICILTALLDSGLRPWWIPWIGWVALFLGSLGALLWVSGTSLPRNPAICFLVGEQGLPSSTARRVAAVIGGVCWLLAMVIILAPIGQSYPEVPEWISRL